VDEQLLSPSFLRVVVLLHYIVNLTNGGRDQQAENEGKDIPMPSPEEDVDRVEETEEGESPRDGIDDDFGTSRGELED
jgi:hypothetical protein